MWKYELDYRRITEGLDYDGECSFLLDMVALSEGFNHLVVGDEISGAKRIVQFARRMDFPFGGIYRDNIEEYLDWVNWNDVKEYFDMNIVSFCPILKEIKRWGRDDRFKKKFKERFKDIVSSFKLKEIWSMYYGEVALIKIQMGLTEMLKAERCKKETQYAERLQMELNLTNEELDHIRQKHGKDARKAIFLEHVHI